MLKKVRFQLTLFCTAMTGGILMIMTIFYLWVSESNLKDSHFTSFQNEMKNIISGLEGTNIITEYYLSSLEAGGRYYVFLEDNGTPLLYGNIIDNAERKEKQKLLEEIKKFCQNNFEMESALNFSDAAASFIPYHFEFIYESLPKNGMRKDRYYVCAAAFPKQQGGLCVYILAPIADFYRQLSEQRMIFAGINLTALILLYFFFYQFTGHLLRPIRENQEKQSQFVASASHELRTPLSVILSSASLIPNSKDEEKEKLCAAIVQEGSVMKRLLNEMLLLAGTDSHTLTINKTENEPDTFVLNCVEAFEPLSREKKQTLCTKLPDEALAPCLFDKERMEQVLAVLLHNAISYTPENGTITVSLESLPKGHIQINVADTGIGISDKDKKQIFDRFYRADASRSKKDHFGLGLSIAKEIVKEHKGSLTVTDTPGGGATFIVKI